VLHPGGDSISFSQTIKSIPFDSYFHVFADTMQFNQIIPDISVENGLKNIKLINSIYSTVYKSFFDRFEFKDRKLLYNRKQIVSYIIMFQNDKISFHIGLPSLTNEFLKQRYFQSFPNITILPCSDCLNVLDLSKTMQFNFMQKEESFKSIQADMRSENPIPSLLSISKDIKESDILILEILLGPLDSYEKEVLENSKNKYNKSGNKFQNKTVIDKIFNVIPFILDMIFAVLDCLFEMKTEDIDKKVKPIFSSYTNQKINYDLFNAMIRVFVQSDDAVKQLQIGKSIEVCLRDIAGDNEIVIDKKFQPKNTLRKMPKFTKNIYSAKEIAVFMQLPSGYYQKEYSIIESIDTKEINLPSELFQDGIPIGEVKYKGLTKIASWNMKDVNIATLPLASCGIMGSGKTEAMINYSISAFEKGQSVFILDGIKNCEFSTKVRDYCMNIDDKKIIDLDFSNTDYIIPLLWNEIKLNGKLSQSEKLRISNFITQQLILFLDSLVSDNVQQKLSPRMKRYLNACGLLVFSLDRQTTIMDVLNCLIDYDFRHKFIKESKLSKDSKIVKDLLMLDKNGKETNFTDIKGIVDRIDLILGDYILSNLFSYTSKTELNFRYFSDNGYLILCRMPQTKLSDNTINTMSTFLLSKIWLSVLGRQGNNMSNVIIDEIHRYPSASAVLEFALRESRKYKTKFVFSAHKPSDFKDILSTLKSAGTNYMLYNTSIDNVRYFEEEIKPFTLREMLDTKRFHAKCIVNTGSNNSQYTVFDTKVIPPINFTRKEIDRSYLTKECQLKYGIKNYL